jgi:hypothetical protein
MRIVFAEYPLGRAAVRIVRSRRKPAGLDCFGYGALHRKSGSTSDGITLSPDHLSFVLFSGEGIELKFASSEGAGDDGQMHVERLYREFNLEANVVAWRSAWAGEHRQDSSNERRGGGTTGSGVVGGRG